jgi:hypothetical protein
LILNARDTIANDYRGKGFAFTECLIFNSFYANRDSDRGEGGAISESQHPNVSNALWDRNGGEGGATSKSPISNARNCVRNNCLLTSSNKCVGRFLDNCVAISAAIIGRITIYYHHRC